MGEKIHDTPSEVDAAEGQVLVNGPNGVSVSMTPEAALETSERLEKGAILAKGQIASREARRRPVSE
ncbi:MAG TPA: hypothetical protein VEC11_12910 [Allosphingosinicella sp.]|nr:hypothetical protein [Allosphingosinicella sp.]